MLRLSRFSSYCLISWLLAIGIVVNAYLTHHQFYPTVVHLSTSKISKGALMNLGVVIVVLIGSGIKSLFFGRLREVEVETINENSVVTIFETCLALTMFREEIGVKLLSLFVLSLFVKIFHWIGKCRMDLIEQQTPGLPRASPKRLFSLLVVLLAVDSWMVYKNVSHVLAHGPSISLLFASEYLIMLSEAIITVLRFILHMEDMARPEGWDRKGEFKFYLELAGDLFQCLVYIVFVGIIFMYYGLALHLARDLFVAIKRLLKRISDFVRYRRIVSNMDERFPTATAEEIAASDPTCIVCREDMTHNAKKLRCGHIFHAHCLRSWLERQQSCPTCRTDVEPPAAQAQPAAAATAVPAQNAQAIPQHHVPGVVPHHYVPPQQPFQAPPAAAVPTSPFAFPQPWGVPPAMDPSTMGMAGFWVPPTPQASQDGSQSQFPSPYPAGYFPPPMMFIPVPAPFMSPSQPSGDGSQQPTSPSAFYPSPFMPMPMFGTASPFQTFPYFPPSQPSQDQVQPQGGSSSGTSQPTQASQPSPAVERTEPPPPQRAETAEQRELRLRRLQFYNRSQSQDRD